MTTAVELPSKKVLLAVALGFAISSCGGDSADSDDDNNDTETNTESDSQTDEPPADWIHAVVEEADVGLLAKIDVSATGSPAVAYFANAGYEDGICDEVEVNPPTRMRQALRYAYRQGEGAAAVWVAEQVDAPVTALAPTGLAFAFSPAGDPALAYTGGEPQDQYCGSNDAVFAVRGTAGWTFDTASRESGDSVTGDPASDSGFVVGLWPALAFDAAGEPAILHKDAHFGTMQHDDKFRADAEFAWHSAGSWTHEAVDPGEGAGDYGGLVFDSENRPVAAYAITIEAQDASRHGVWAARRETDGTWVLVKLHTGAIFQEVVLARHPSTLEISVAFYSAKDYAVRVRSLSDPTQFADAEAWTSEVVGDARYDEGRYVDLDYTPLGDLALAYHRCKRITSTTDGCDQNDEAAVFALKRSGSWSYDVVQPADKGSCGEYTSLAFDQNTTAFVAYRCTVERDEGFVYRLFVAQKAMGVQ